MTSNIKEISKGNKIKPNSFRTSFEQGKFTLEFGEYIEKDSIVNILSQIDFSEEDIIMFIKSMLLSIAEYQQKTGVNIVDKLGEALIIDETAVDSNGK